MVGLIFKVSHSLHRGIVLFVLLFLAQLFYASARNLNRLAPGFFVSLALTIVTGVVVMTLKDKGRPNVLLRQRMRAASGRIRSDSDPDSAEEN